MAVTRTNAVVFLDKEYFDYYEEPLQTPLRFTFLPQTVQHMDVVDGDTLEAQLTTFITTNKLLPASITILLSDHLLFCKEIPLTTTPAEESDAAQDFLDIVPFDHILSKVYRLEKKVILVSTNRDFIDVFQNAFVKAQGIVDSCVPVFLLGKSLQITQGLTKEQAKLVIQHTGNIRPWTMPITQNIIEVPTDVKSTNSKPETSIDPSSTDVKDIPPDLPNKPEKPNKMRLYAMVGAFVFLFLIMIGLFLRMNQENAKDAAVSKAHEQAALEQTQSQSQAKQAAVPTPTTAAAFVLEPTPASSAFSATADEQNLHVTIQYAASAASAAAQVKNILTTFGLANITSTESDSFSGSQNLVLFTSNVGKATQQRILTDVQQAVPSATTEIDDALSVDVLILLK